MNHPGTLSKLGTQQLDYWMSSGVKSVNSGLWRYAEKFLLSKNSSGGLWKIQDLVETDHSFQIRSKPTCYLNYLYFETRRDAIAAIDEYLENLR